MGGILYLPIEIKSRELDGKLLLAYYALSEGYQVIIGEHSKVQEASSIYPRGIFLGKGYARGFRKKVLTQADQRGHYVVELDEEGLVFPDENIYLRSRMHQDLLPQIDHVYCWGDSQKRVIEKAYPQFKSNCTVTGNPRFDLLSPKYRVLYQEKGEELKNKYGPYILINTRFTLYNTISGKKGGHLSPQEEYIKKLYGHFISMIKQLSKNHPALAFIVRPHPAERLESYQEDLLGLENVQVIRSGYVLHWLLGASALIHNGCTTGIEGYLLDKMVISYMPVQSPTFDVPLTQDVSQTVTSLKELQILISQSESSWIKGKRIRREKKKSALLPEFYGPEKRNEFAYRIILGHLASVSLSSENKRPSKHYRFKRDTRKKIKQMFPSLISQEIADFFKGIDRIEQQNQTEHVKITMLADRLFHLKN
ncbi:surface carbohydrate biosynthesis protein [Halobacillus sp. H74]|uniref:surface carbohydrate biosynthesis protein n=1 Tax=Halobacillus sp. H74 TaxID=3457436 RepID=UPI003FCE4F86